MNTDTTDNGPESAKSAFGDKGTRLNSMSYGHPYGEQIIEGAKEVLRESETGRLLIKVHNVHNVPIHVLKGNGPSGYNPQSGVIYLQVPSKVDSVKPDIILELVKGLREADQQLIGYVAPDPAKDITKYAAIMHAKALDSIIYICKVLKELTNSSSFPVLLDAMDNLGHIKLYEAYDREASEQELYDVYAGKI